MLKKIRSFHIFKILFTYLNDARKLKLIKYNKRIQRKININLINYKSYYDRYITYVIQGKGEEYNSYNNMLIYEGEYSNGIKNGKGKIYHFGKLKFEGIFDEQINGKGKEYNEDGELIYEGESLKEERNGKGKEYNYHGELKFDGDFLNGKRNGKGKEYNYDGKLIFDGDFLNGKRNGMEN